MRFRDRIDAGRQMASRLASYANRHDVIVLALPRGGVPVGFEVARHLRAPFDVFVVRKLGVPMHPELAMGAIATGGVRVLSEDLIAELAIPRSLIEQVAVKERLELERRERLYRGDRRLPTQRGRTAILVDDGLATGSTMEAAIAALRLYEPARIVVAAPVGAAETCARLQCLADEVVCAMTPQPFNAVGLWYERFDQTTDEEVIELLRHGPSEPAAGVQSLRTGRDEGEVVETIRARAHHLSGDAHVYDALVEAVGDAPLVLLGEASHGTHEFYRERAFITERLIAERGFNAVAVEADWPDAYRVNRYVRGASEDQDAVAALGDFGRFPTWMWRNTDVVEFIGWLRARNDMKPAGRRVGFYGLDLYSLRASMQAVLAYLGKVDREAERRARDRYACFDRFGEDPQAYGYATGFGLTPTCEQEVVTELVEMQRRAAEYAARDGRIAADEFFFAEQNARLVKNAEQYYRTMFRGRGESWNLRDRHMAEILGELLAFLDRTTGTSRVVVWAHNSHVGDARATQMGRAGELNVGQLVRQRFGANAVLIGFTTHTGTVTAASEWDQPPWRRHVRPSLPGSYERLFHDAGIDRFLLPLRDDRALASALATERLERAIGVIYLPARERTSHYFSARLPEQFDFVLHFDHTRAVEPLERTAGWQAEEPAETFPSGL